MNKDELDQLQDMFNKGVIEGTKHSIPSPETLSRLNKIEESLREITNTFLEHSQKRDEHLQTMLSEFREGMIDVKIS